MNDFLARLLIASSDAALADSILGDLEEGRRSRARRSRVAAALWFVCALGAILLRAFATRLWRAIRAGGPNARRWPMETRQALRSLGRTPWYTATVIGVVTLGMTLATTVFAIVDGVLLKPLPYPEADRLVSVQGGWTAQPIWSDNVTASRSDAAAWAAAIPEADFARYTLGGRVQIDDGDPAPSAEVDERFLTLLGQPPLIGGFLAEHFSASASAMPVLVTYQTWQRRFGGDPSLVGRVISVDRERPIQVVGILPVSFLFPSAAGRFVPAVITPLRSRPGDTDNRGRGTSVIAKLPANESARKMEARLLDATLALAGRFPRRPGDRGLGPFDAVRVVPLDAALRSGSRQTFALVALAAALLMLLACLNVTGLAVARTQDRQRELALRRSLGGTARDLIRLLALENAIVVTIGSATGLAAAWPLVSAVQTLLPNSLVLLKPLAVDLRVVGFVAVAIGACTVLTTLWPIRVCIRANIRETIAGAGGSTRQLGGFGRRGLVATQVAVGVILATAGGLLTMSLIRVWQEDPGYRVADTAALWLSERRDAPLPVVNDLLRDVRSLAEVTAAGGSDMWVLQRAVRGSSFTAPAGALEDSDVESIGITAGFLETTGLAPISGRWPTHAELLSGAPVVIVSERVARDYWRGAPAVGQFLARRDQIFTVVGVVGDARYQALDVEPDGAIYYPMAASTTPELVNVFVTFRPGADRGLQSVLALLADRYPMFRVRRAQSVTETLADSIRLRQFRALLFGGFGLGGLVIVAVGVLGLSAMVAGRRTREVGVRLALGATPAAVAGLMVRQEARTVFWGDRGRQRHLVVDRRTPAKLPVWRGHA
ncbi:MAG: ABC transporter permease [Acidobacteria bacterium]|nr:ABC transporter permease [Acidobacteriota bacterium]